MKGFLPGRLVIVISLGMVFPLGNTKHQNFHLRLWEIEVFLERLLGAANAFTPTDMICMVDKTTSACGGIMLAWQRENMAH